MSLAATSVRTLLPFGNGTDGAGMLANLTVLKRDDQFALILLLCRGRRLGAAPAVLCLYCHRYFYVYQQVIAPSVVKHALPVHLVYGDARAYSDFFGDPDDVRFPR